ncbi:hypothetical protein Lesp01_88830 [Lentzea sp. NBRC 102530]|nr:hypothetical protein [Lentzea sp. NBRC 102530]GLY55228.1 hypothetical protein Lesp01_88830 [Lentzea sp. NBRC 102530]
MGGEGTSADQLCLQDLAGRLDAQPFLETGTPTFEVVVAKRPPPW